MSWNYSDFQKWITSGCEKDVGKTIHTLNLASNRLTSFARPQSGLTTLPDSISLLTNLHTLHLSSNQLTTLPNSIVALTNLRKLDLTKNRLTSLARPLCGLTTLPDSISLLTNLCELNLTSNRLTTLPDSISLLTNLHTLYISDNQLTTLPDSISALTNLRELDLNGNRLTSLARPLCGLTTLPDSISLLTNLRTLLLYGNRLTTLPDSISALTNLHEFSLYNNQLTALPPCLGNLPRLQYFFYSGNPVDYIPANVLRMINRNKTAQGVYNDSQSVHNSTIQKSLLDSVNRLLAIPIPVGNIINSILEDSILSETTKARLVEYSEDTSVHTVLNLTFSEMLTVVWNRIGMLESRDEIKKTLNTEILDAECKCFTGKISRLVNCLAGYDDLVVVEIADKEQIGTVIEIVRNRLGASYTVEEHMRLSIVELVERGYSREVIDEWVGYIE